MRQLILAVPLVLLAGPAFAECTQADVQKKAMELATGVQQLAAKNPQAAMEWGKKMSDAQTTAMQSKSMDDACALYDKLSAELKAAN